ncbi:MAG: hypothetical protein IIB25_12055 [Chloroflexi bacterium]|nr:hypothetical protein [Chloroflexota bacterium]
MAGLIYERTGIHLPECKLTLLSNRLRRRLKALELSRFREYYDLLRDPKACEAELPHFLSAVTTNETYFFRNENLWKFVRKKWIPELIAKKEKGSRSIRVWSAASSSGEEAYTTAICLLTELPDFEKWRVEVIGSDISVSMLDRAKAGEYNEYAIAKVPKPLLLKWFEKRDGVYVVRQAVRAPVKV